MTPIHRVGITDRTDSCDIYCGRLVFKSFLLVPEAYLWCKLSVFNSLHATCLNLINYYWSHLWAHRVINRLLGLVFVHTSPLMVQFSIILWGLGGSLTKTESSNYSNFDEICRVIDHNWWYIRDFGFKISFYNLMKSIIVPPFLTSSPLM